MAFADGEQEGRESGVEAGAEIGAGLDQRFDDFDIAFGRGPHERGLPALGSPWRGRRRRAASSAFTASTLPVRAAVIKAVSPPGSVVFGSAPAFSSSSIIAALPFVQASESGVTP